MYKFDSVQPENQLSRKQRLRELMAPYDLVDPSADDRPFDLSDPSVIEANLHGKLTLAQIEMIKNARLAFPWWLMIIVPIAAAVTWVAFPKLYELINLLNATALIMLFALPVLTDYVRRRRIKLALATGRIEQIPGEVVDIGRKSQAQSGERRLLMIDNRYPLPPEGRYLFFVPEGSIYLLSAQSLDGLESGAMNLQAREKLLVGLSRANNFSPDELALNRDGCLSERQSRRLIASTVKMLAGGLLLAFAILGFGLFFLLKVVQGWWLVLIGVFALLLLAIPLTMAVSGLHLILDLRDGQVVQVDGLVNRSPSFSNGSLSSVSYYYAHENFGYKVSKEAYRALVPGLRYRIYQTPRTHRLMSLEPLENKISQGEA